uniref:Uncharacterized protein n=1 Tax=Setaria viridis TaxID=4556 RepID=A0A4U6VLV9_SETVI|nr:hypothetical protein SEVIR_2G053700v2 [Setaria viridis]
MATATRINCFLGLKNWSSYLSRQCASNLPRPRTPGGGGRGRSQEDTFVLLRNPRGGEACRILHANMAGHATLYNADTRSVVAVPDLGESKGFKPIPFAVAGTGAGEESLYLMRVPVPRTPLIFEVLRFDGGSSSRSKLLMDLDPTNSLRWHPLPRPPPLRGDGCFGSSTVKLPFQDRAEYVPELDTWLGFSPDHPHHPCAADLSGVASMAPPQLAPTPHHVWEDFSLPPTEESSLVLNEDFPGIVRRTTVVWWAEQLHLVSLGSGRFCVAKGRLTVLIGVEMVRGGEGGLRLRMVKHKSKRFMFPGNGIKCVL